MLIFDLDGTLLDSNGIWEDVDRAFLARHGASWTPEYQEHMAHTPLEQCAEYARDYLGLDMDDRGIIAEWMELAGDAYEHAPLKPFAREYLQQVRDQGHRTALFTTAVPSHVRTALRVHGLYGLFDHVLTTRGLGADKRFPDGYLKAAAAMGADPADCTVFDDSLLACRAAKAAGMRVIAVYDERDAHKATDLKAVADRYVLGFEELINHT